MTIITAICGRCLHSVDAAELDNPLRKCDHCRGIQETVTFADKGRRGGVTAATNRAIEDLHAGGHALLDLRTSGDCGEFSE